MFKSFFIISYITATKWLRDTLRNWCVRVIFFLPKLVTSCRFVINDVLFTTLVYFWKKDLWIFYYEISWIIYFPLLVDSISLCFRINNLILENFYLENKFISSDFIKRVLLFLSHTISFIIIIFICVFVLFLL